MYVQVTQDKHEMLCEVTSVRYQFGRRRFRTCKTQFVVFKATLRKRHFIDTYLELRRVTRGEERKTVLLDEMV